MNLFIAFTDNLVSDKAIEETILYKNDKRLNMTQSSKDLSSAVRGLHYRYSLHSLTLMSKIQRGYYYPI